MSSVLAVSAAAALAACGGGNDNAAAGGDSAAAAAAPGTHGTAPAGAGGQATPADSASGAVAATGSTAQLTDPDIVALTQAADEGEIATSKIAVQKATNAEVKQYAQKMIDEHTKMITARNALLKTTGAQPAAGAKDSSAQMRDQMVAMLNSAPKGLTFDTAYVNGQVMAHQNTLDFVRRAEGAAQAEPLKDQLRKAAPAVEKHLNEAKALQGKLGGGAAQ